MVDKEHVSQEAQAKVGNTEARVPRESWAPTGVGSSLQPQLLSLLLD